MHSYALLCSNAKRHKDQVKAQAAVDRRRVHSRSYRLRSDRLEAMAMRNVRKSWKRSWRITAIPKTTAAKTKAKGSGPIRPPSDMSPQQQQQLHRCHQPVLHSTSRLRCCNAWRTARHLRRSRCIRRLQARRRSLGSLRARHRTFLRNRRRTRVQILLHGLAQAAVLRRKRDRAFDSGDCDKYGCMLYFALLVFLCMGYALVVTAVKCCKGLNLSEIVAGGPENSRANARL